MKIYFDIDDDLQLVGASVEMEPIELLLLKKALQDYSDDTKNNWIDRQFVWRMLLDYKRSLEGLKKESRERK